MNANTIKLILGQVFSKTGVIVLLFLMALITPGTIYLLNFYEELFLKLSVIQLIFVVFSISSAFLFTGAILSVFLEAVSTKFLRFSFGYEKSICFGIGSALFVGIVPDEILISVFLSRINVIGIDGVYTYLISNMITITCILFVFYIVQIILDRVL